jgi:hypothetical protein
MEERVAPFNPPMVGERWQKMNEGWWASSLPPISFVSTKDEVENLC